MKTLVNKTIVLGLTICIFFFSCSNKQVIPIWKISKKNAPTSYLIGIIDFLDKKENVKLITNDIIEYFDSAKTIITPLDEINSDFVITNDYIKNQNEYSLKDILSSSDFKNLKSKKIKFDELIPNSFPLPDSSKIKLLFYIQDILDVEKKDYIYFDYIWMQRAMPQKKVQIGLESYQEYYKTLSEVTKKEQIDFLNQIDDFHDYSKSFSAKINKQYLKGNFQEIHTQYLDYYPFLKSNYDLFFSNKHTKWASKIDSNLNSEIFKRWKDYDLLVK